MRGYSEGMWRVDVWMRVEGRCVVSVEGRCVGEGGGVWVSDRVRVGMCVCGGVGMWVREG